MKKIFLILSLLFSSLFVFSQSPSHFKYQGVARDINNLPFTNTGLGIKVSIVLDSGSGSGSGLVQYAEKHLVFTSPVGVFSLNIGAGQNIFGDIEEINWANGSYWLKIEMDVNGGEDYVYMGTSPILPVPLAIHAMTVDDKDDADANPENELQTISFNPNTNQLTISEGNTINIPAGQADADADPQNELQTLQFNANTNTLSLTNGGQVDLSTLGEGGGSDDQTLQLNGTNLSIENGNQINLASLQDGVEDADANPQNEIQTIAFDPNTNQLSISEGNTINIPAGQADADADPENELQNLELNGTNLSIENGNQVNLAAIQDGVEDADANPQNEIQTISFDPNTNQLSISEGNTINIPAGQADADADPQNELQNLQLNGTNLSIENGNQVNLAAIQDGVEDADADPNNEIQTILFDADNNILSLTDGGQVDLTSLEGGAGSDNQILQLNGTNLSIENGNQVNLAAIQDGTQDADADPNNEIQNLQLNGTTLSIESGNNVNLAAIQDGVNDADSDPNNEIQTISFDPNTNLLSISEGNTINIPAGGADADADPMNELQNLIFDSENNRITISEGNTIDLNDPELFLVGTNLQILGSGSSVDLSSVQDGTEDADADPQNELQNLQLNGTNLSIENGNQVNLAAIQDGTEDADANPTNEIQALSLNGTTLSLNNGGGQVNLNGIGGSSLWSQAADNDLFTQEDVAIGFAESQLSTLEVKEDITIRNNSGNTTIDFFSNSTGGHIYAYKGNGTGGSNDLLVNIDAAQSGGSINLRNTNGSIRGEFSIGSSTNNLFLRAPDEDDGFNVSSSNTSTSLSLGMPNGSEGVQVGSSAFGGSATFSGSTGNDVAFIGRNGGNPTTGKLTIGSSGESELISISVNNPDGTGAQAAKIDGFNSQGNDLFRLGSFIDDQTKGLLNIFASNGTASVQVIGDAGGKIQLNGSISKNVIIGTTSTSSDLGLISVYDALDTESAGMYTNFAGQGILFADVKNFRMDHPVDNTKEIWYACVEGPEAAAYERGTAQLTNGEALITFPDHFGLVSNHETMTVMLTPLSADCKGLAVIEKTATGFKVKELFQGSGTYQFDWEVKCVRKGYENYEPIREKKDRL